MTYLTRFSLGCVVIAVLSLSGCATNTVRVVQERSRYGSRAWRQQIGAGVIRKRSRLGCRAGRSLVVSNNTRT